MYQDSTGKLIRVSDRVRFRGKEYTIKEFFPDLGMHETARIVFEEKQHILDWADEITVDLIEEKEERVLSGHEVLLGKSDSRPKKGAWAPGSYTRKCAGCKELFAGDKRALNCADCAYKPDRARLHKDGTVTIDNVALPVQADDDFTTTEWGKILDYYPQYVRWCERKDFEPMDTLAYVLGFCRKLEEAKIERDGHPRTVEGGV